MLPTTPLVVIDRHHAWQPLSVGRSTARADWIDGVRQGFLLGVAIAALLLPPALPTSPAPGSRVSSTKALSEYRPARRYADFAAEAPSADARRLADWVVSSGDNQQQFFVLVDKKIQRYLCSTPMERCGGPPLY